MVKVILFLILILSVVIFFRKYDFHSSHPLILVDREIIIPARRGVIAAGDGPNDTEMDSVYLTEPKTVDLDKAAIVLIDVWDSHPNEGWIERVYENMEAKIKPLLEVARQNNITILHANHGEKMWKGINLGVDEFNISEAGIETSDEFSEYLKSKGIETLFYAGYATNLCLMFRDVGMLKMHDQGFDIVLLRDCTIGWESPRSLDGEWAKKVSIDMVENFIGKTITLDEFEKAIGGFVPPSGLIPRLFAPEYKTFDYIKKNLSIYYEN